MPTLLRIAGFPARHAFTTRQGGVSSGPYDSLNLGASVGDDPANVEENRRRVLALFGATPETTARVHQVHGTRVVEASEAGPEVRADGLTSDDPDHTLVISAADCAALLFVDARRGAVAAVHAGWRGVVAGIVTAAVEALAERYASEPKDLHVAIGPNISAVRYQVGPEVVEAFVSAGFPAAIATPDPERAGHARMSVAAAVRFSLAQAGVPARQLVAGGWCTASDPSLFYSHRRDRGSTGRHWALLRAPGRNRA